MGVAGSHCVVLVVVGIRLPSSSSSSSNSHADPSAPSPSPPVCTTFSDCIESIPPTITRSISDLRELDAVLSSNLQAMSDKIARLLEMIERPAGDGDPTNTPQHRFSLLREIAEEARSFKPGGEDKIRVATGTCETVSRTDGADR